MEFAGNTATGALDVSCPSEHPWGCCYCSGQLETGWMWEDEPQRAEEVNDAVSHLLNLRGNPVTNKWKDTLIWCTALSKYVPHIFAYLIDLDFHLLWLQIYCWRDSYHTQPIFLCILLNIKYSLSWKLFEIKVEELNNSSILCT